MHEKLCQPSHHNADRYSDDRLVKYRGNGQGKDNDAYIEKDWSQSGNGKGTKRIEDSHGESREAYKEQVGEHDLGEQRGRG